MSQLLSVDVFKTRKNISCENVPEMHLLGKISKKKKIFLKNFFRVGPVFKGRSGNRKHKIYSMRP